VYRVIQEALTNCVRHASASRIGVQVTGTAQSLEVAVSDDGVGLEPARRRAGLGLRGIEERVRDLRGTMLLQSAAEKGTAVMIRLPLPESPARTEAALARAAG
jgi:signal transduction histidine kinase